jgi:hypothetical protein
MALFGILVVVVRRSPSALMMWSGGRAEPRYLDIRRGDTFFMKKVLQVLHHPAGRIGLTLGLTFGVVAAFMGEASKALFLAGFCKFLASRIRH